MSKDVTILEKSLSRNSARQVVVLDLLFLLQVQ